MTLGRKRVKSQGQDLLGLSKYKIYQNAITPGNITRPPHAGDIGI